MQGWSKSGPTLLTLGLIHVEEASFELLLKFMRTQVAALNFVVLWTIFLIFQKKNQYFKSVCIFKKKVFLTQMQMC